MDQLIHTEYAAMNYDNLDMIKEIIKERDSGNEEVCVAVSRLTMQHLAESMQMAKNIHPDLHQSMIVRKAIQ